MMTLVIDMVDYMYKSLNILRDSMKVKATGGMVLRYSITTGLSNVINEAKQYKCYDVPLYNRFTNACRRLLINIHPSYNSARALKLCHKLARIPSTNMV